MPQDSSKRWIVVLDKVPRGPLTEEEVLALLEQGILRFNDMGFEVVPKDEATDRSPSAWKLLWQFPQFDRRGLEGEGEDTPPPPERRHGAEKASVPIPEPAPPEALPPEALDFDPQQLVLGKRAGRGADVRDDEGLSGSVQFTEDDENDRAKMWIGASVGFLLCSVVLFAWLGGSPEPRKRRLQTGIAAPSQTTARTPVRRQRTQVQDGRRTVKPRPRRVPARKAAPAPERRSARPAPVKPKPRDPVYEDDLPQDADRGEILEELDEEFIDDDRQPRLRRPRALPDDPPFDDELPPDDNFEEFPPDSPPQELIDEAWEEEEF